MKKLAFFLIPVLVVASCAKEFNTNDPVVSGEKVLVKATIDNSETKTDYIISGSKATFFWSGTEEIGCLYWDTYMGQTAYTSTTEANSGETELTFSGDEFTNDTGFAVYPKKGASNGAGFDWYSADGYLYLAEAITYNPSAPLKNIVPMLGKLNTENKYVFKPVTGVIGVRILHVPANATKITISTNDGSKISQGLRYTAGTASLPDELDAIYDGGLQISAARSDAKSTKTYNVSSLDFDTEYTFYYPLPVGTITGGVTITVYNGTTELYSKSSTADLVVKRGTITRLPLITLPNETWTSMGTGKFIDTFVWSENSFGSTPVEVEFFKSSLAGRYRIANPYAAAANLNGITPEGADDYFVFNLGEKGRVTYEWVNMGLSLSKNTAKKWAMLDGYSVAGYENGYARSHVVSYDASGNVANLQLAPCYRTSDENQSGGPSSYDNEVGKDAANGIIEIAFPGNDILMPYTDINKITVSSNSSDSAGASGLIDDDLTNCWHTPWGSASTTFDTTYGEYVDVRLNEGLSKFAFNYCTRNTTAQGGAPAKVIVGGSKNGADWTVIGTFEFSYMTSSSPNTWIGLPVVNASDYAFVRFGVATNQNGHDLTNVTLSSQWCNLAELKIYGITTGAAAPYEAIPGKVDLTTSMITVSANETYSGDDGGPAALVDGDTSTHWHSPWSFAGTYDSTYGIYVDIDLGAGNGLTNFKLRFCLRNCLNDHPDHVKIYASTDGTNWGSAVGEMSSIYSTYGQGNWTDFVNCVASTQSRYIRISILSTNGNNSNVSNLTSSGCTHMAEIELYSLD